MILKSFNSPANLQRLAVELNKIPGFFVSLTRLSNQSLTSVTALPAAIPTGKILQVITATDQTDRTTNGSTTYDSYGNQLDMIYKDLVAGKFDTTGTWATHVKAVKDANPKP